MLLAMQDIDFSLDATYRALLSALPAHIILNLREAANESSLDRWDVTVGREVSARGEEMNMTLPSMRSGRSTTDAGTNRAE